MWHYMLIMNGDKDDEECKSSVNGAVMAKGSAC